MYRESLFFPGGDDEFISLSFMVRSMNKSLNDAVWVANIGKRLRTLPDLSHPFMEGSKTSYTNAKWSTREGCERKYLSLCFLLFDI